MRATRTVRLASILVGLVVLTAACTTGQPQVGVETDEFDFGEVNIGEIVSRDLTVTNEGTANLSIESITTSCGCTSAAIDLTQIKPGESTTLHITFDGGAHGDVTGFYTRQVFIATNDPTQPELRVQFTANVIRGSNQ